MQKFTIAPLTVSHLITEASHYRLCKWVKTALCKDVWADLCKHKPSVKRDFSLVKRWGCIWGFIWGQLSSLLESLGIGCSWNSDCPVVWDRAENASVSAVVTYLSLQCSWHQEEIFSRYRPVEFVRLLCAAWWGCCSTLSWACRACSALRYCWGFEEQCQPSFLPCPQQVNHLQRKKKNSVQSKY